MKRNGTGVAMLAAVVAGFWIGNVQAGQPASIPDFRSLSPDARRALDARALNLADEQPADPNGHVVGTLSAWLISQSPLSADEERDCATAVHDQIVAEYRTLPTPAVARDLLARLVAELPPRMRPEGWTFSLTVLDAPHAESFTVGGGRLYVTKPYLDALLADPDHAQGRLAFALGGELGHIGLQHCRRAYQLIDLQQTLERSPVSQVDVADLRSLVADVARRVGERLSFLYSGQQVFEADLFALHLARNAGLNLEDGLDVVRGWAEISDATPPAAKNDPSEVRRAVVAATPLVRLRALRLEVDGAVNSDAAGMCEYDRASGQCRRLIDNPLRKGERAIVFLHGLGSDLEHFHTMIDDFARDERTAGVRLIGLRYPNDASLWRMGRFLKREMNRICESPEAVDFVCHSAGGLVFREYAEIEGGPFRRAVFVGTPHAGSDLAKLRPLLEARRLTRGFQLRYPEALDSAITDGRGQIGFDLQPDSLFLRYLARGNPSLPRYVVIRGQAFDPAKAAIVELGLSVVRTGLTRALERGDGNGRLHRLGAKAVADLKLPAEISRGDLAVTLDSAALEGASATETYALNHTELCRNPAVIDHVRRHLLK